MKRRMNKEPCISVGKPQVVAWKLNYHTGAALGRNFGCVHRTTLFRPLVPST